MMIKTFEKTLSVQIDDTVIREIVGLILENVYDDDLIDYINDSLDDESREAFGIMIENDGFVKDEIIIYIRNTILDKFGIEKE
jgi:uncharacterized alkaline shock family protein YloU